MFCALCICNVAKVCLGRHFFFHFLFLFFFFFIFISNFFLSLIFRLFNVALRDALAISCSVYTYLRSDFFVCQSAKVYFYLSTAALKCEIHIFVLVYTQTQMAVACWKGLSFAICFVLLFVSFPFHSVRLPFLLTWLISQICFLLATSFLAAALCCNNFTIPDTIFTFYTSKARIVWSVVLCCVVVIFHFLAILLIWIVELNCQCALWPSFSLYIPGYLVVYECVCLCSFISAAQQKLCSVRLIHSIFYST